MMVSKKMDSAVLSRRAAAQYIGVTCRTLSSLPIPHMEVEAGVGGRPKKFYRYAVVDLDKFLTAHTTTRQEWQPDTSKRKSA